MNLLILAALIAGCVAEQGYYYPRPEYPYEPEYYPYPDSRPVPDDGYVYPTNYQSGGSFGGGGAAFGTAKSEDMPWHAGIYKKTTSPYMQVCGGTLVTTNVIISAAHCFWSYSMEKVMPASYFAIAVGKLYRPWGDTQDRFQRSDIREIKVPPRFLGSTTNFQDDLALLVLATPVRLAPNVQLACLDFDHELESTQLQAGNLGRVGGWGLTGEDGNPAAVLQTAQLPYVPIEQCIAGSPPGFLPYITSDKICAGFKNGSALCMGDSGGGLVFPTRDRQCLRGIVSVAPTSDRLCNLYAWGVFTLVSSHEWFIKDFMRQLS